MTPAEVAAKLQYHNDWRRGHHDEQPDPRVIGEALDAAVEMIDRLEAAEKERDALCAKIEAMEKQEPVAWMSSRNGFICKENKNPDYNVPLYALPGAQQCKNCNGMGDRFDPSGEKIPCDLCESHLEEIRALVAEAAHDIISGSDFWLSISLAAKKIYAPPGAKGEDK